MAFGYDEPPLLPLLQVPLAFDTALTAELVLLPVVSVLVGATLAGIVHAVLAGFRVPFGTRLAATALIVLNPAWLYFTTTGLPTIGDMLGVVAGFRPRRLAAAREPAVDPVWWSRWRSGCSPGTR